jgi:hypothetical protein
MTAHKHRSKKAHTIPFFGAVSSKANPAAHGGSCNVFECACGATKKVNVNGTHLEKGEWVVGQ